MRFSDACVELAQKFAAFKSQAEYEDDVDRRFPVGSMEYQYYRTAYKKQDWRASIYVSGELSRGLSISVSIGGRNIVAFTLQQYPVCCGAKLLYNFSHGAAIPADRLTPLLDQMFKELVSAGYLHPYARLIVMMVEYRKAKADWNNTTNIEPIETPHMQYPELWKYFQTQQKVNTRLMYNANSGNVLHDMEVILK